LTIRISQLKLQNSSQVPHNRERETMTPAQTTVHAINNAVKAVADRMVVVIDARAVTAGTTVVIDAVKAANGVSSKVNVVRVAERDAKAATATTVVAGRRITVNVREKHQRRVVSKYAGKGLNCHYNPYSVYRWLPLDHEGAIMAI
jgi:hypothetical protein